MALNPQALTDPATIAVNRTGALTPEQRTLLERQARVEAPIRACSCLFLGIFGATFLVSALVSLLAILGSGASPLLALIVVPFLLVGVGAIAGAVGAPAAGMRKVRRLRDALAVGRVAQEEGVVTFTRRGYIATVAGVRLDPPRTMGELHLPPGRYRFYYLPVALVLLAAEPLEAAAPAQPFSAPAADPLAGLPGYTPAPPAFGPAPGMSSGPLDAPGGGLQDALARGLRFSAEDLAANREGWLTGRQRLGLLWGALGLGVFAAIFGSSAIFILREVALSGQMGFAGWLFFAAFAAGTLLPLLAALRRAFDVLLGGAEAIEGVTDGKVSSSGESTTYYYVVHQPGKDRRFQVGALAYKALVPGRRYRLYYARLSGKVVGIEPLG